MGGKKTISLFKVGIESKGALFESFDERGLVDELLCLPWFDFCGMAFN